MGEGILIFLEGDVTVISYINKPRFLPSSRPSMAQPLHRIGQHYPWCVHRWANGVSPRWFQRDRLRTPGAGRPRGPLLREPYRLPWLLGEPAAARVCEPRRTILLHAAGGERLVGGGERNKGTSAAWISPQSFASALCGAIHWTTQRPSSW